MLHKQSNILEINNRYIVTHELGKGAMGRVYRAYDRLTRQDVAIKVVNVTNETSTEHASTTDLRVALAQEFKVLAGLRHPNIISVIDYGFTEDRQPYFAMELIEDGHTLLESAGGLSVNERLQFIVQILLALDYLHRRGILHRDLKPSNVLVANRTAKVLDFGLSTPKKRKTDEENETVGTLAYMAPEVLQGTPAMEVSDLYAVGVMMYELISGDHPYNTNDLTTLIMSIVSHVPDVSVLDVSAELQTLVYSLMEKDTRYRTGSAREAIDQLTDILNISNQLENTEIRESYLQAAAFVGREPEWKTLTGEISLALKGQGGGVLIGGESGVGKSRLMDEIRIWTMVKGGMFLKGQEVQTGGSPYQVWRNIIRQLILHVEVTDFEAQVLTAMIPDISELLGRNITPPPDIAPQAAAERLVITVENVIKRTEQPLILLLEDLHWGSSESLGLLERIYQMVSQKRIYLIGTYRDDETTNLPERLPQFKRMKLNRLDRTALEALSESMLGAEGSQAHVVDFLQRQTEGNIFFLIEVIRALAEMTGNLEKIGTMTLPKEIVAGGIQKVIENRLNRVPENGRKRLQVAALMGRELDELVLQQISSPMDYPQWLLTCSNAAVLEVQDNQWRFTHDKLREMLVNGLNENPQQLVDLHREIALTMETVYGDAPQAVASMAYHWFHANEHNKALYYLEISARQALFTGNYEGTIALVERMQKIAPADISAERRARWLGMLGEAYYSMGQIGAGRAQLEQTVKALGWKIPQSLIGGIWPILMQGARQMLHRFFPRWFVGKSKHPVEKVLMVTQALHPLSAIYLIENHVIGMLYVTLLGLNLAEANQPHPEIERQQAEFNAIMSVTMAFIPVHSAAWAYRNRALEITTRTDDYPNWTWARSAQVSSLFTLGLGTWDLTQKALDDACDLYQNIGDLRRLEEGLGIAGFNAYYRGDYQAAEGYWTRCMESSRVRNDVHSIGFSVLGLSQVIYKSHTADYVERTREFLDEYSHFQDEITDPALRTMYDSLLASLRFDDGAYDEAWVAASRAADVLKGGSLRLTYATDIYAAVAHVILSLWEAQQAGILEGLSEEYARQLPAQANKICTALRKYSKIVPISRPAMYLHNGRYQRLINGGNLSQAITLWQKGAQEARELKMLHELEYLNDWLEQYSKTL